MQVVNNSPEVCAKRRELLKEVASHEGNSIIEVIEKPGCLAALFGPKEIRHQLSITPVQNTDETVLVLPPTDRTVEKVVLTDNGEIREFVLRRGGSLLISTSGEVLQASNSKGPIGTDNVFIDTLARVATANTDQVLAQGKLISNKTIQPSNPAER